jgi:hypothetical protein
MPAVGEIWTDHQFAIHNGQTIPHHMLVLGVDKYDATCRLLTTRDYQRPQVAGCQLVGVNQPGFFLGVVGGSPHLQSPTWVNLRGFPDIDLVVWSRHSGTRFTLTTALDPARLCGVLRCILGSNDLTAREEKRVYASIAALGCP